MQIGNILTKIEEEKTNSEGTESEKSFLFNESKKDKYDFSDKQNSSTEGNLFSNSQINF